MKDLKKIVESNREIFDEKVPPGKIWGVINTSLPSNRIWNSLILWRAAAVLFLLISAGLFLNQGGSSEKNNNSLLKEYAAIESFYNRQIDDKIGLVKNMNGNLSGFTGDFHQLEAMFSVLKEEMEKNPSERIKDALVLNLLVRIDLLNQQLGVLETRKARNEEKIGV